MNIRSLKASIIILCVLGTLSILALVIPTVRDLGTTHHLDNLLANPSLKNLLGTDHFGRDILVRSLQAFSVSLGTAVGSTLISAIIGLILGLLSHFSYRWVDRSIILITNILLSIPSFILGAICVLLLGNDALSFSIAMGIGYTPFFTRMMRAQIFSLKNRDFILSSHLMGVSSFYIIRNHILPFLWPFFIMQATMSLQGVILASTSLNFIGLGISPPTAEWGTMIFESQTFIAQSLLPFIVPILFFIITMVCVYRISAHFEYKDLV